MTLLVQSSRDVMLRGLNRVWLWGMMVFLGGCFLVMDPVSGLAHPGHFMPEVQDLRLSMANRPSGSSAARVVVSSDFPRSEKKSVENTGPSSPGKSSQHVPASPEQQPATLVPEIPENENGQMVVTYKAKIEETQNLMRTINESQLTKEQHDTYISIHSFLEKSQEAFSQDDMPMAMNLAEKSHTLVKEIVNNSMKP